MLGKLNFIKRIGDILCGSGKQRRKLAIENVLYVIFAFVCAFLLVKLFQNRTSETISCENANKWFWAWIGIFACAVGAIEFLLLGVISQIVMFFCTLFPMFDPERREDNVAPFAISLLTIILTVVAICIVIFVML